MSDERKSPWNSLEVAKLIVGLLIPLVIFVLGYQVNRSFRAADEARSEAAVKAQQLQKELEDAKRGAETRQLAVGNFSRFIYERRVRSELLLSSLRRHSANPVAESKQELLERKRLYDDAYVAWNANHQANLLLVRQVLGSAMYSNFEALVEFRLAAKTFAPLDGCLTQAYDLAVRGKDPRSLLDECNAKELVQRALDCGYAITDELYKLSAGGSNAGASASIVDSRCPARRPTRPSSGRPTAGFAARWPPLMSNVRRHETLPSPLEHLNPYESTA